MKRKHLISFLFVTIFFVSIQSAIYGQQPVPPSKSPQPAKDTAAMMKTPPVVVTLKLWMEGSSPGDSSDAGMLNPLQFRWKREHKFTIPNNPNQETPSGVFDIKIAKMPFCAPGTGSDCSSQTALQSIVKTHTIIDLPNQNRLLLGNPKVFVFNFDNKIIATPPNENLRPGNTYVIQVWEKEGGKVVASSQAITFDYRYQP